MTSSKTPPVNVSPMDEYNQKLVENLHPKNWQNPQPQNCYNLVVIGGGTAGLVTAAAAGLLGAKVALIEKHLLGGDCTNVGCVPSKALIRSSRVAAAIKQSQAYGIQIPEGMKIDFAAVMERMRKIRSEISENDSAKRFSEEFGVDVFLGEAQFFSRNTIKVAGETLKFKKAAIATGSHPAIPPIEGLEKAGYLTNKTVFNLTQLPSRIAIIGGGYIGCELAQTFQRLGSQVTVLQRGERVLKKSDPEASFKIHQVFADEKLF
jgi:pyruvate/2-oxoglutarate dehydrogenase complex dihydrolipoamide dehydrogenase (E3) component